MPDGRVLDIDATDYNVSDGILIFIMDDTAVADFKVWDYFTIEEYSSPIYNPMPPSAPQPTNPR
jgi:hypothetical protein